MKIKGYMRVREIEYEDEGHLQPERSFTLYSRLEEEIYSVAGVRRDSPSMWIMQQR